MDEDEIVSAEEDAFYYYTAPSDPGPEVMDPGANGSDLSGDLPPQLSSQLPTQLTGDGASSTIISAVDHLNSTLGIDLVSIITTIATVVVILILTRLVAKMVDRALTVQIP